MQTLSPNEATPATGHAEPTLGEGTKIGGCYVLRRNLSKPDARPVWVASDEVLGKDVTLHFVPASVAADARAMTELRQEVKRNRQLIHPNILRVYDFVEDGNHVAISMDEFEGESLDELLKKKGTLDPADIKPWMAQLTETLADAHRIQLFHRDLSPENIYLRPNGGLLVSNFGISRVILSSLERAGIAKGAAAHLHGLSPQQLDGDRPNASDDIYSLGALMHTLLAGSPPFAGDDMVQQIRKTVPMPVSEVRTAMGVSAPVSDAWERLIASCLEKNPDARPRNLTDVLTMLGQDSGPAKAQAASVVAQAAVTAEKAVTTAVAESLAEMDAPLKAAVSPEGGSSTSAAEKPAAGEPVSGKPLHPEIPPITSQPAARKTPLAGALSANFPDLDRPRSKAPLVWLLLAAGIIGGGIYLRNKPEPAEADANGGVSRIDEPVNPPVGTSPEQGKAPGTKPQDQLPDPVPVTPPKKAPPTEVASVQSVKPAPTAPVAPPKVEAMPAPKPPKATALIGIETDPAPKTLDAPKTPPVDVVPATLAGMASGKAVTEPKAAIPEAKVATPVKSPATSPEMTGTKSPITIGVSTPIASGASVTPVTPVTPPEKTPATAKGEPAPTVPVAIPVKQPAAAVAKAPLPTVPDPIPPIQKLVLPEKVTTTQLADVKKQREAAIENIRSTATIADTAHQEASRRLEAAKAEKDRRQKELDAKRKTLGPVIQQAEALAAERKKFEEEAARAITAAAEAAKQAEAVKRKLEETIAKSGEKLQASQQAEGELKAAAAELTGASKEVDEISQVLSKADAIRMQARVSQQQIEQDLQKISVAADKAQRVEKELRRKANLEKIAAIEKQIAELNVQSKKFDATIEPLKELGDAGKPAILKIEEKKAAAQKQIGDLQTEIKRISSGAADAALPVATPVKEASTVPPTPVKEPAAEPPPVVPTVPVVATIPTTPEKPVPPAPEAPAAATNSLGMKFAPVGDIQFGVYLVTVKDFEAFARATGLKSEAWKNPGFKQGPDHPVVNVTWREAEAFCKWLTEKERKAGLLKGGEIYRLPTDLEWSKAVGLPPETGSTPEERDMGVQDVYPWGSQWPPPPGAGNYAGEETQTEIPIPNYNDGFPNTSPVGKFKANPAGLYDMGGNVWQWVADSWNGENRAKTLRGGSWYNGAIPLSLLSSCRISSSPDTLHDTYGFRIIKAAEPAKPHRRN